MPDNRKNQFISTAENLLVKVQQQEAAVNSSLQREYEYIINLVRKQPKSI